jgi:hypothetical protein
MSKQKTLIIPKTNLGSKYRGLYLTPVAALFTQAGYSIQSSDEIGLLRGAKAKTKYDILINGQKAMIDFSNHPDCRESDYPCFKFHYIEKRHKGYPNMYPFLQPCVPNFSKYLALRRKVTYTAKGLVRNQQRAYAGATKRRKRVRRMIAEHFRDKCSVALAKKVGAYWKQAAHTSCAVFVPGARNDMMDKGHLQYMGLGVCTISPHITTMFPRFKHMVDGEHFVECAGDYSNLIDKIQWCMDNPKECLRIGKNAQELFNRSCLPVSAVSWVEEVMEKHYK